MGLSHGLAGVLHVQICLSHFSMATYHDCGGNNVKGENFEGSDEWFRMQVATTMNIDCPWWMDWFHGGLQFQIEHHLFPRVPRHNLREVQRMVKDFCKREGLYHHSVSFLQGNKEVIGGLYQ